MRMSWIWRRLLGRGWGRSWMGRAKRRWRMWIWRMGVGRRWWRMWRVRRRVRRNRRWMGEWLDKGCVNGTVWFGM
ncbi:hypothetical protein BDY21DRAFT_346589 [Lineolata rhizophorae]|uniref:Uncharacterized protein n=1 Tax=Lineolata rhizophorae TaxID=578093 RepID=A0A6A6P0G6_9PEZI|nr:hypothetical protein BDY21DRAFT_346589 [Lineolata rhizophorae]